MTRSLYKGPFCEIKNKGSLIKVPFYLHKNFLVYNGKAFIPLTISEEMIGHKFGEFSTTRKKPIHKNKKK
jgi:ribosomal protein S19